MKKVYASEIEGPRRRGRPLVRWKDMIKEYMHQGSAYRGGRFEQARRECLDKERWSLFCSGHFHWEMFLEGTRYHKLYI